MNISAGGLPNEADDFVRALESDGSSGHLLSTRWSQSGVLPIGDNVTVTHNEFTPFDSTTEGTHSLTGCTNTAAAQIIYYFIEQGLLDLELTLSAADEFTSSYNGSTVTVKADGSTPGTISFAAVNDYLADFRVDSALCAAALLYACGVVQHANYSASATSTSWHADLFYRAGFASVTDTYMSHSDKYYWVGSESDGKYRISDGGFEVLIENLQAGRPVGTSIPGHALVIDGYDAENDLFHINYGWGSSTSTRWYSREEMYEEQYNHFVYDLLVEPPGTLTVSDSRLYGTGTLIRAVEQAAAYRGADTVLFGAAAAGQTLELQKGIKLKDEITIRDHNMDLLVTGDGTYDYYGWYGTETATAAFENFGGALIVNRSTANSYTANNYGFYFYNSPLSLTACGAIIYAGSYASGGDYSAGAATVLASLRSARNNGTAVDDAILSAASYSVYGGAGDDDVRFADGTLVLGKCAFGSGNNTLSVSGGSRLCGTVTASDGDDSVSVTGGSELVGDLSLGSGDNTVTVDSTSSITGRLSGSSSLLFVLDGAARDEAIFTVTTSAYDLYARTAVTVDISAAEAGSYTLFAVADGTSYASYLSKLAVTVTGGPGGDVVLSCSGTATSSYADLSFAENALKLQVRESSLTTLPRVVSTAADTVDPTNRDVTVTAVFNGCVATRQYSLDGANWRSYPEAGVVMTANGTVYFRGIDAQNRVSDVAEYAVGNIDRVAPDRPTAQADITAPTNRNVTVSAVFSEDSVQREYSRDGTTWHACTAGVVMHANGVVRFRGIDAAGNVSEVTSYTVSNIDKSVPAPPTVSTDAAALAAGRIVAVARFSDDSVTREYSLDGTTWRTYDGAGVPMENTGKAYFRGTNALGTVSNIAEYSAYYDLDVTERTLRLVRGAADRTVVGSNGHFHVSSAAVNSTTVNSGGYLRISSGGVASSTTVNSRGYMYISSGGAADSATVNSGGGIYVSSGGVASSTTINSGGWMYVSNDGAASSATVNSGGGIYVSSGGVASSTTINSGGWMYVSNGGVASSTTVNSGGWMYVKSGGTVNATTVNSSGYMYVSSGGTAAATTVDSGGSMRVSSGGRLTGQLAVSSGGIVSAYTGSLVDFDISGVSPGAAARVNDLSLVRGTPDFTITVAQNQANGTYKLAGGAANFNKTVTICNTAGVCDSLTVGGTVKLAGQDFALKLDSGTLSLTVSGTPEPTPVVSLVPGDLDGDGRADVIMTVTQSGHGAEGATGAWLIRNDQTPAWGDLSQRNAGWEIFGMGVTTAGKATNDVYVKNADNVIGAWVTDDSGHVSGWETVGQFDDSTQILGLGDFNADGQTDLLLRNVNGAVGCFFTSGDTTGWNYFQSLGDEWKIAAVGDLNGDGRDDVVLKHDAGFAGSWLTQSDGTMVWANLDTLPEGFAVIGAGDFDGDGVDDVLLKKGSYYGAWLVEAGSVKSWFGIGDLGGVTVEQIADFDGDGKDDLRIRTAAGDIGSQLVRAADTLEWRYYGSVGAEWSTSLAAI